MIEAQVVADSVSPTGQRLTTVQYTAHRFILAEINTHGSIAKNARSSRAVPTKKLCEEVRTNPALPIRLGYNQPGMVAETDLGPEQLAFERQAYLEEARWAATRAELRAERGVHKQWANRIMEPFMWVHGLLTATDDAWDLFFKTRIHPAAQPEFFTLATAIKLARDISTPKLLQHGEWHLPYVNPEEDIRLQHRDGTPLIEVFQKLSVARCARVSVTPYDGNPTYEREQQRYDLLKSEGHWSPFEHVATPDMMVTGRIPAPSKWSHPEDHRRFTGWRQYRAFVGG